MNKKIYIFLLIISPITLMSQTMPFNNAVKELFFGVDIIQSSSSLLDSFISNINLKLDSNIIWQSNLNTTIALNDENAKSVNYKFGFTKSPLQNLKIDSGCITLRIAQTKNTKKLLDINWHSQFTNEVDAKLFYDKLIEMFKPISTLNKTDYDEDVGDISQYSTRNSQEKGLKDISFILTKSLVTNKYEIYLSLLNEFSGN